MLVLIDFMADVKPFLSIYYLDRCYCQEILGNNICQDNADDYNRVIGIAQLKAFSCAKKRPHFMVSAIS